MSSASGHQSRFLWPLRPPVNGHLPALLSSVFASMFFLCSCTEIVFALFCTAGPREPLLAAGYQLVEELTGDIQVLACSLYQV